MNIGKISVSNPVLLNIMMVAILVLGAFSYVKLPRETFSNVDFSWVFIAVPYPGVGAGEVEKNVTIKIEQGLEGLDRVRRISSVSRDGISFLNVEFEEGISRSEFLRLFQDLRTEFDKVPLPDGTLDPWIDEFSSSDFSPLITVVIKGDAHPAEINKAANDLRDRILALSDINKVDIVGNREREVWVEVDKNKMEAHNLSLHQIADALKNRNTNIAGGVLTTASREYLLRTIGEVERTGDLGRVIVRRGKAEGTVRISDIATVSEGFAEASYDSRYNLESSVSLFVSKKSEGNSLRAVEQIREIVKEYEGELPENVTVTFFNDISIYIRGSLETLTSNAILGFFLLVGVLFVFLGLKNAILTAIGIPLTFAITFLFMDFYGETLNGNSLFALVLVLGMIVDHAIVIIENCYRHKQLGKSKHEAAIAGTNEVIKPVLAATATTVAAFLPLMLLPGIMGKFMRIIPLVVCFALVASMLEAMFFLPSHFAEWGGSAIERGNKFFLRVQALFSVIITKLYKHKYLTMTITVFVILISFVITPFLRQDLYGGESFSFFYIDIHMPEGTPRSATDRVVTRFEERLNPLIGNGEIESVISTTGFLLGETDQLEKNSVAQIIVDIRERKDGRKRPVRVIMDDISGMLSDIPGAENVAFRMVNNGPPVDKPVSLRLQGRNLEDMAALAEIFRNHLEQYEELYNIQDNYESGSPELKIAVNEERAAELGLSVAQIGFYIRTAFDGIQATTFFDEDEEVDVIVKLADFNRLSVEDVLSIRIPTHDGRLIPFTTVCEVSYDVGIVGIRRVDGEREITVTADADDKRRVRSIMDGINDLWETRYKETFRGITLKAGGEFEEFNKIIEDLLRLLWIGIFLIYMILGAQFKSYTQPLLMIFTVFFGIVGCILFLFVTLTPVSIVVLFAAVALIGIAVNDSIVLISFVNSLRRQGMDTADAVIEGAKTRLRPILLTSVTTIGGLVPMAMALGNGDELWSAMASTIMFGLIFSTMGTLLVIPCAYGILDDITSFLGGKMRLEGE
ncbi:Acriflavin resistance protein [Chitinispirillum alkaliphilum]|nr:Acriflavin resistance protein [Chitinispirillum alkaliphilum]